MNHQLDPRTDLFISVDLSLHWLAGQWKSGRARIGAMPDGAGSGWGVQVGAYRRVWKTAGLRVSLRHEMPGFSACGEDAYFPFCRSKGVTSLLMGIQRKVRR